MKSSTKKTLPFTHLGKTALEKGFALISTVLIMSLLLILGMAMLSLSSTSSRSSEAGRHQQIAEANARMAAMIALGQLQEAMGPDTRVTANASVANPTSPNPYWVSVYKTRVNEDLTASTPVSGNFMIDHHEDPLYLTDLRETQQLESFTHLVSGNATPDTELNDSNSIIVLDTGRKETTVRVPLVKLNDASLAYWVSDNSVKGLYNKTNPYVTEGNTSPDTSNQVYYDTTVAQSLNFDDLQINGEKPLAEYRNQSQQDLDKGLSLSTATLLFSELKGDLLKESFHLLTSDSAAVFSNPKVGGLKRDLTPFIEKGNMELASSSEDNDRGLEPLLTTDAIIKGEHHNMTSPKFGIFKDWADMRFKVQGLNSAATIPTQTSSSSFVQTFEHSIPLKRRDLTNVAENYIQPIVVEASLGWDFSPYGEQPTEKLRTHIFPRLILWNPYNVTLNARKYVMLTKLPGYGKFSYRSTGLFEKKQFMYKLLLNMDKTNENNIDDTFPGFITTEVTLAPGECKVFSPYINPEESSLNGRAREFNPLDYSKNVLSAEDAPGNNNFYVDTQKLLTVAETDENENAPYGFAGSNNSFFGFKSQASDEYIILQSNSPNPTGITPASLKDTNYETIAHFFAQANIEARREKWYAARHSQHASNGQLYFEDISQWSDDRLPPRLWRRGIRMQWFDETAESQTSNKYNGRHASLTVPLIASANLRGGMLNHQNALGTGFNTGWQMPYLNGYSYFRQPTDPELFKSFFPISPIGKPNDGFPERVILFDIPRENPGIFSLGQFQHAQFSYLPWHPTYILGSSYSTEQSDLDATALRDDPAYFNVKNTNRWTTWGNETYKADNVAQIGSSDDPVAKKHGGEVLIYDVSYELNHYFWDHYMLSSVPYSGASDNRVINWAGSSDLPIAQYKIRSTEQYSIPQLLSKMKDSDAFLHYHASEMFLNHGVLNVNCDKKEIWKSLLLSLQNKNRPNLANEETEDGTTGISRSILPSNAGSQSIGSSTDDKAWNGFRALTKDEIDRLAGEIVKQLQKRGPFLSISDFINRRLSLDKTIASSGALQAAIDASGINQDLETESGLDGDKAIESAQQSKLLKSIENRADFKTAGLPGYFSQNDLITVIAPSLTVRGDTYTIRGYGDSRDTSGQVKAKAYCEIVVQRVPEYVDPSDSAIEPVRKYDQESKTWILNERSETSEVEEGLSAINLKLGRKFKILKFRWLSPSEI